MIHIQALICAALLWATNVHAARTVDGDVPLSQPMFAYHAFVIHRETRKVVCQSSTVNRPDLVPEGWASPSGSPSQSAHLPYPSCQGEALETLIYAGQNARPVVKSALLLPMAPVLMWVCGVGLVTGINAALAYEMNQGERPLDFSMYKDDVATGSLGGAVGGGGIVVASELWAGADFTWPLAATGSAGAGLVCGAIGGTGAFVVLYLLSAF